MHFQGKSDDWLKRLVPMLTSENRQAQSLAAFHFAMEAAVKNEQKNLKVRISEIVSVSLCTHDLLIFLLKTNAATRS